MSSRTDIVASVTVSMGSPALDPYPFSDRTRCSRSISFTADDCYEVVTIAVSDRLAGDDGCAPAEALARI